MTIRNRFSITALAATTLLSAAAFAGTPLLPGSAIPAQGEPLAGNGRLANPRKGAGITGISRLGERNPLKPPFTEVFDDYPAGAEYEQFDRYFQFINSDGDKNPSGSDRSWGLYNYNGETGGRQYSKCAYLQYPLEVQRCDDWLIPRAIKLEAGNYYLVKMDASLFLEGPVHSMEVRMGEYNDAEGMTVEVIPPTDITSIRPRQIEGWFVPEFDGLYYMGIHGISDKVRAEGGYLFVDNISVEAPRSGREPGQVSGVTFLSDPDGTPSTSISFTLPELAIDGSLLSGDLSVAISREDQLIATLSGAPGQSLGLSDIVDKAAYHNYTFIVSNGVGAGASKRLSTYVGMAAPVAPSLDAFSEVETGKVRIAWSAPAADLNGTPINPDKLRYNVYDVEPSGTTLRSSGINATEATFDIEVPGDGQETAMMMVTATINDLESEPAVSDVIFVGTPYPLPYVQHFTGADNEPAVVAQADPGVSWRMLDDFSDPKAQDGDGGYIAMVGSQPDQWGELSTGKIDLSSASDPFISFYTYIYEDDENVLELRAIDLESGEYVPLAKYTLLDVGTIGWTRILCPLRDIAGKTVRLLLGARIVSHGYVPFDNMTVDNLPEIDLAVDNLEYIPYAYGDEDYEVVARISNIGARDVEDAMARLYCDDKLVCEVPTGDIPSFGNTTVLLSGRFTAVSPEMPFFHVEVYAEGDANPDNDASGKFNIAFLAPNHPVVDDLRAEDLDNAVLLSWSAPDLSKAAPAEALEDFESYAPYTTNLRGFTMFDEDEGYISGFSGVDFPMAGTQQAFWTMKAEGELSFLSTLGQSSLFTMATVNDSRRPIRNADWLISPELYGGRQTIGFRACSQTIQYGYETFEVYASSASTDIFDFKLVQAEVRVPDAWTQYFVTLPAGTKYFAICCTSDDAYLFTLDDISYTPAGTPRPIELIGYNVYRNGEKLNDLPISETSYRAPRDTKDDIFFVTVLYDLGESTASNIIGYGNNGISGIGQDAAQTEYFDLRGMRVDPRNLLPGLYIRKTANKVEKIMIR